MSNSHNNNDKNMRGAFIGRAPSIIYGAKAGDISEIEAALSNGSDVNEINPENGLTALHYAAGLGNLTAVELLLTQPGIRMDIKDMWGRDGMEMATLSGNREIITAMNRVLAEQIGFLSDDDPTGGTPRNVTRLRSEKRSPS